jgi:signal transduction histidine kinase
MLQIEALSKEKKAQYMVTMQNQVERVVRLFNDIKMLQRYDMDEHFIDKEAVEIGSFLENIITTYEPLAQEKNIELTLKITTNASVHADRDKLDQVMDNLIMNALKYTNEGSIKVLCEQIETQIQISVEDTGIGIASEHLDRLFDRFYRTDKARSRDKGGTGLGLAVVRGILKAHDTDILVSSEVGKGSRFYFQLPIIT